MNIAQQKALSLLEKNTLPFITSSESDFMIARNSAINEINFERCKTGMFQQDYWNDVYEELMKINHETYCKLNK